MQMCGSQIQCRFCCFWVVFSFIGRSVACWLFWVVLSPFGRFIAFGNHFNNKSLINKRCEVLNLWITSIRHTSFIASSLQLRGTGRAYFVQPTPTILERLIPRRIRVNILVTPVQYRCARLAHRSYTVPTTLQLRDASRLSEQRLRNSYCFKQSGLHLLILLAPTAACGSACTQYRRLSIFLVQPRWGMIDSNDHFGRLGHQSTLWSIIPVARRLLDSTAIREYPAHVLLHKLIPFLLRYGTTIQFRLPEIKPRLHLSRCAAGIQDNAAQY